MADATAPQDSERKAPPTDVLADTAGVSDGMLQAKVAVDFVQETDGRFPTRVTILQRLGPWEYERYADGTFYRTQRIKALWLVIPSVLAVLVVFIGVWRYNGGKSGTLPGRDIKFANEAELQTAMNGAVGTVEVRNAKFEETGRGLGVFIFQRGTFVTALDLVQNAYLVTIKTGDGVIYMADGIDGLNVPANLAVLRVRESLTQPLDVNIANKFLENTEVFSINSPVGATGRFMLKGVIQSTRRDTNPMIEASDDLSPTFVRTNLNLAPTSLGGPVFDINGQLHGFMTVTPKKANEQLSEYVTGDALIRSLVRRDLVRRFAGYGSRPIPASQAVALDTIWTAMQAKEYGTALKGLKDLGDAPKNSFFYWSILAWIHREMGSFQLAIMAYSKALVLDPEDAQTHYEMGRTYQLLGQTTQALRKYDDALLKNASLPNAHRQKGLCFLKESNYQRAMETFQNAIQMDANDAESYRYLGQCLAHFGRHQEAVGTFNTAIQLNPKDAIALYMLGLSTMRLGQFDQAEEAFRRCIDLDSESEVAKDARAQRDLIKRRRTE